MPRYIHMLVVDECDTDAEFFARTFHQCQPTGECTRVHDCAEAVDYLLKKGRYSHERKDVHPKAIILDIGTHGMSGLNLLKQIKADTELKDIPVIVFTASDEPEDKKACYDAGVNSYLVKPVEYPRYTKTVSDACNYWMGVNNCP